MGLIKGLQLRLVQSLYGIPGSQSSGVTEVDLDNVQQVINVVPEVLRRSDNVIGNNQGGWFQGTMQNVHSGADAELSTYVPYKMTVAGGTTVVGAAPGFPAPIPEGWDVWLIGCSLERTAGAGSVVALLSLNDNPLGWGIDDSGAAVTGSPLISLVRFTSIVNDVGGYGYGIGADGMAFQRVGIRLPPKIDFEFRTNSTAAATVQLSIVMGLFPEGMGQDILV